MGILQNFLHMLYIHSTNHNLEQADGKSLDYIWSIHQNINFDKLQSVKWLILYNFEATYLQIASYYWLLNNLTFFNRLYIKARGSKYYLSDAFPSSIYSWSISHMWEHGFFTFGRLAVVRKFSEMTEILPNYPTFWAMCIMWNELTPPSGFPRSLMSYVQ